MRIISIHAPRAGCDSIARRSLTRSGEFQSTHPVRGATEFVKQHFAKGQISIHAPRAGCDRATQGGFPCRRNFNPRTPCGVRPSSAVSDGCSCYFNPRTPCGVRPTIPVCFCKRALFQSTHPVRGATENKVIIIDESQFQSTHPVRGATLTIISILPTLQISIHAPRAGCDLEYRKRGFYNDYFNPRTPCGVRRLGWGGVRMDAIISIHAPRAGCDVRSHVGTGSCNEFQSTHPVRGATRSAP